MRTVYLTPKGRHFHAVSDCRRIRCGQRAKKSSSAPTGVLISELPAGTSPCLTCFPDAPRVRTFHGFCDICGTGSPCAHNGGVLVEVPRTWHSGSSLLLSPGERTVARRYVWPEAAHRYRVVHS